jgi:hypothetical protein
MFIRFLCICCGHKLKAPPDLAGKRARCTRCSQAVVVPRPEAKRLVKETEPSQRPTTAIPPACGERKTSSVFVAAVPLLETSVKEKTFSVWLGGVATAGL